MHVELNLEQLAELHRRGLSGGALAWRPGMREWRPLLVLAELRRSISATAARLMDPISRSGSSRAGRSVVPPPPSARSVKPAGASATRIESQRAPAPARPQSAPPPAGARAHAITLAPPERRTAAPRTSGSEPPLPAFGRELPVEALPTVIVAQEEPAPMPLMGASARAWLIGVAVACTVVGFTAAFAFRSKGGGKAVARAAAVAPQASNCPTDSTKQSSVFASGQEQPLSARLTATPFGALAAGGGALGGNVPGTANPGVPVVSVEQLVPSTSPLESPAPTGPVVTVDQLAPASAPVVSVDSLEQSDPEPASPHKKRRSRAIHVRLSDEPRPHRKKSKKAREALTHSATLPVAPERSAISSALSLAASSAAACGARAGESAQVMVTFGPSGGARSVHFAHGPSDPAVANCVLRVMGRARVPAFSGEPVMVRKTVHF